MVASMRMIVFLIIFYLDFGSSQSKCGNMKDSGVIPLVVASGANLATCEEGLDYLRNDLGDDYLYITVVVGPARSGKSLFLNNIAGDNPSHGTGFSVGHTPLGHTKGFWISPKHNQSKVRTESGDVVSLFLDTEGFAAIGNLAAYDPKLCAIVSIFASNLLYNVMKTISMEDLKFLSSIAGLDRYFEKSHDSSFSTPPLTWVLQDFGLLLDDFSPPDEIGYMKHILSKKADEKGLDEKDKMQIDSYNALLDSITEKFRPGEEGRGVLENGSLPPIVLLDNPSRMHKQHELASLKFEEYSPEYKSQIQRIREQIRAGASRKQLSEGIPLTGKTFAANIELLTESLNQLSEVGDAYVRSVAKQVAVEVFDAYNASARGLPSPSASQSKYHIDLAAVREGYLLKFNTSLVGKLDDPVNVEVTRYLIKDIFNEERVLIEQNTRDHFSRCHDMGVDFTSTLSDPLACADLCLSPQDGVEPEPAELLRKCYDQLRSDYLDVCSKHWCDVLSASHLQCYNSLEKSSGAFETRLADVYETRMKSLSSQGFVSFAMYVFGTYVLISFLSFFGMKNELLSRVVGALVVSLGLLRLEDGVLIRMTVCTQTFVPIDNFSASCNFWVSELPKVIGVGYNVYMLPFLGSCRLLCHSAFGLWQHSHSFVLFVAKLVFSGVARIAYPSSIDSNRIVERYEDQVVRITSGLWIVYSIMFAYFLLSAATSVMKYVWKKRI